MSTLSSLPFREQLEVLAALVEGGRDPGPLLRETAALSDPEPFVRLLVLLSTTGRIDGALATVLIDIVAALPDAALQHLLAEDALSPLLGQLLPDALRRWDLSRLTALALVLRWLRRAAPEVAASLFEEHEALLLAAPDERAGRALSFASGPTLARLALDPLWAETVERSVARAIEVLARAPKSISQANAERLLSRRVYADPGHFFFELLQNADDAGATRFLVSVRETEIALRHDGAPFSILDLVGVLSIGQTTKSEEQIGFFGVGFKSVYEVTDRPRVHSGALSFEIAHVSIPRAVRAPDASGQDRDTVLVLPRSRQKAPASTLFSRASAIPPETLMTLAHVRALVLEGPAGERLAWRVSQDEAGLVLRGSSGPEDGELEARVRRYRVLRREVHFEGPRPEGRARRSTVLVAAALDREGLPCPVEGATLYAFLPTAERTGLRVLIHARFDVTLDRERLELDSAWNEHLLREAGLALGALAASLSGEAGLSVLHRGSDLSPALRGLHQASIEALCDVAFLFGAGGELLRPSQAALASSDLAQALAGVSLPEGRRMLAPLPAREAEVALELGAQRFGPLELLRFCTKSLRAGAPAPPWLGAPALSALAEAPVDDAALAQLPVLVDAEGKLLAPNRAEVAAPVCVALYAGWRDRAVLVEERALEALPAALHARLAVPRFELETLVSDLRSEGPRAALLEREALLLSALESLDPSLVPELLTIPFAPTIEGARAAPSQLRRLSPELAPLLPLLSAQLPFAEASFAARPLGQVLLAVFDRSDLAQALEEGLVLDEVGCDALTRLLDRLASSESISPSLARRFSCQPLWEDVHGGPRRALVSGQPALSARDEEAQLVPEWPWLKEPERSFVRSRSLPRVDASFLARSLAERTWPSVPEARIPAVLEHLSRHASELSGAEVEGLARASVWSDASSVLRPLAALRRGTPSRALDALFSRLGERHVAAPRSLALADALGLGGRVPQHDHAALVADLSRSELDGALDATLDTALQQALVEAASVLSSAELAPLATLPIFADAEGRRLPLGHWRDHGSAPGLYVAGPHRAVLSQAVFSQGPWSLLSEAQEQALAPLLDALGIEPPTLDEIMARATLLAPGPLLAFAIAHAAFLSMAHRDVLAELPLFTNLHGEPRPSRALVLPTDLSGLDVEALGLGDAVASEPSAEAMAKLELPRAELPRLLPRVLGPLVLGAPLDACFPSSIEAFAALASLCVRAGMDLRDLRDVPLGLDAGGRLARPPLMSPTPSARALLSFQRTDGAEDGLRLVEPRYAAALEPLARAALTAPLSPRQILEVLRGDPDRVELPRLYAWLLEEREAIAADPASRGLLGSAPLFPSQKGERRAPRDLVLDVTVPDLGLGWGLDASVPEALARWLRATFELDRHARRALVAHLLDGLVAAADEDDVARARELLAFLARALGAGECSPAELEERVRRLEVRARLLVPVIEAATGARRWDKPRFAWSPRDETAARATLFVEDLPPTIVLHAAPDGDPDPPTLLLLTACGAKDDLDDGTVIERLDAMAHLPSGARRALSRYVLVRVHEGPARIERWQLRTRAWVVSGDALFPPSERVWPDPMARALLGEGGAGLFVDAELVRALSSLDPTSDAAKDTARRLSFRGGSSLTLDEVGAAQRGRVASPELLTWIEAGLTAGQLQGAAVREAFIGLRLLDDEGRARPLEELCVRGARSLFGPRRGDWSTGASFPRAARALRIPVEPDAARIAAFLVEVGGLVAVGGVQVGASVGPSDEDALVRSVPHTLARLATFADARLPEGAGLAVESARGIRLVRLGDPALSLLSPPSLLSALEDADGGPLSELLVPLPRSRSPQLEALLLAAGIPDLFSALRITKVFPSSPRPELDEAAETLRRRLAPLSALRAVRRARVCGSLSIEGIVTIGSGVPLRGPLHMEGAIDGETLWVTPAALADPIGLAPVLCPEPRSRRELAQVLALPKPLTPSTSGSSSARVEALAPPSGILDRVRRFFGGAPETGVSQPKPARPPSESPDPSRAVRAASDRQEREERFFRPAEHLPSQLEGGEGWLAARREVPAFGFAFAPPTLESPWLYAPKMIVTDFSAPSQRWTSPTRRSPTRKSRADDDVGLLVLRGRLPRGENVLPVPHYGHVQSVRARASGSGAALPSALSIGPSGTSVIALDEAAELEVRMGLGACPAFGSAAPLSFPEALEPIVPDEELPEEALEFVTALDEDEAAATRAFAIRDFVRRRYRYDPSYLEDPAVGRWLARITRGRPSVHLAALHASRDATHLGAGVCYELNTMACELMRRAGIPAGLATGWVMSGGSLSEPDHLWAVAFLEDEGGAPLLLPIDASTTREGRPLEVPRRPAPRIRPPTEASSAPRGMTSREENERMEPSEARPRRAGRPENRSWSEPASSEKRPKKARLPRAELHRVLFHLGQLAGKPLTPEERSEVERALEDPEAAQKLLERLR